MTIIDYLSESETCADYEISEARFKKTMDAVLMGALPVTAFSKKGAVYFDTVEAGEVLSIIDVEGIKISPQNLKKLVYLINVFEAGNLPTGLECEYGDDDLDNGGGLQMDAPVGYSETPIYCSWSYRGIPTHHERLQHQAELIRLLEIHLGSASANKFFLASGEFNPKWKCPTLNVEPLRKLICEINTVTPSASKENLAKIEVIAERIRSLAALYQQL